MDDDCEIDEGGQMKCPEKAPMPPSPPMAGPEVVRIEILYEITYLDRRSVDIPH